MSTVCTRIQHILLPMQASFNGGTHWTVYDTGKRASVLGFINRGGSRTIITIIEKLVAFSCSSSLSPIAATHVHVGNWITSSELPTPVPRLERSFEVWCVPSAAAVTCIRISKWWSIYVQVRLTVPKVKRIVHPLKLDYLRRAGWWCMLAWLAASIIPGFCFGMSSNFVCRNAAA